MPRQRYTHANQLFDGLSTSTALPTERPIAIYYRQSTDAQIGNVSTTMQTVDMVAYLQTYGWADERIIMIDMDAGISGTTKIDERPGMSRLFELITAARIGAVACQDEDRLFRDVTQIQVNIFIEACRTARVLVLTPSMVYDFANAMTGTFHARQFRFKSEMAAEYINAVIRGKLHRAKRRLLTSGRWAGPGMPVGYMADIRKSSPDGSPNEHWRKFAVFEPYAAVVREYFRLFLGFAGNLRQTMRHIQAHGPYFPDPKQCPPPAGYRVVYRIQRNEGKWCPTRTGLGQILTNAQYIGHWMVNGTIVRWDNHPAIVDQETFMRAFNYLSSVGLNGQENPDYRPLQPHARPSLEAERPVERPLCAGMLVSEHQGHWCNVSTFWVSPLQHYTYALCASRAGYYVWCRKAAVIDREIEEVVQRKLLATFDEEVWAASVERFAAEYRDRQRVRDAQLAHLEKVMVNLVGSLDALTNPQMILAAQQRYAQAQTEHARLKSALAVEDASAIQWQALLALKTSCGPAFDNWSKLSRDEKRSILHALVDRIEATALLDKGLQVVIWWKDGSWDEVRMPRRATMGIAWSAEERALLVSLVKEGKTQVEIARCFPNRKWGTIQQKYYLERTELIRLRIRPRAIRDEETYMDYLRRIGETESLARMSSESHPERARRGAPG